MERHQDWYAQVNRELALSEREAREAIAKARERSRSSDAGSVDRVISLPVSPSVRPGGSEIKS
jgi:hypothetical protein